MPACKIHHVDIVAHPRAIRGRVVTPKDLNAFTFSYGNLCDIRQQIVRNICGVFANQATGVGANRIEVAQHCHRPFGIGMV